MARRKKIKKAKRNVRVIAEPVIQKKSEPNYFGIYTAVIVILLLAVAYYHNTYEIPRMRELAVPTASIQQPVVSEQQYRNPELKKMKDLKTGGQLEKKVPVFEKLKMTMSDAPAFDGADPVYSVTVCCPRGLSKEFYTAKMPWAFINYEFEEGLPTVTVFEINSAKKSGKFSIVVLDHTADMEKLKTVSVRIFTELLKSYMPGYEWSGDVRQEMN